MLGYRGAAEAELGWGRAERCVPGARYEQVRGSTAGFGSESGRGWGDPAPEVSHRAWGDAGRLSSEVSSVFVISSVGFVQFIIA